jgi:DegV family protein with EDD domain
MRKVGVVVDTAASIPADLIQKYEINMVPLQAIFTDRTYRDGIDIKTPDELFKLVEKSDKYPTSSAPAPADYLETFRKLSRQTKNIFCVTISSGLSMAFKSASVAKEMAQKEFPGVRIELFDSRETVGGLGMITMAAARAAASGKNLAQVTEVAKEVQKKVNCLLLFDTLDYLARSGRVGRAAALMSAVLSIKPIVEISSATGLVEPVARVRTKPKAINYLMDVAEQRLGAPKTPVRIMVEHTRSPEEAEKLKQRVAERFNCIELLLAEFNPVAALVTGPKGLGLSFYSD